MKSKVKNKKEIGLKSIIKIFILLAFVSTIVFAINTNTKNADGEKLKWSENLESAIKTAKTEKKAILVNFTGSDWCIWCKKLNAEVFSQKEFINYAKKNLVLVKVDFPRNTPQSNETVYYNRQLAQNYNIQGFPTILLLNSSGEVVAQTGYQEGGAKSYVEHIKSFYN